MEMFKNFSFSQKLRVRGSWKTFLLMGLLLLFSLLPGTVFSPIRDQSGDDIIRFHVRAHSNEPQDQEVKNYLAARLLKIYGPLWSRCQSSEQLHVLLEKDRTEIEKTACKILEEKGFSTPVEVLFDKRFFPARFYGDYFYPSGKYTSLTIKIGSGEGENWWCVLFPPLCFTVFPEPSNRAANEKDMGLERTKAKDSASREENIEKEETEEETEKEGNWRFWIIELFH